MSRSLAWWLSLSGLYFSGIPLPAADFLGRQFLGLTNLAGFTATFAANDAVQLTSPWLPTAVAWDELVLSWNVELPPAASLEFEARAAKGTSSTRFYSFGRWCPEPSASQRHSVSGQSDDDGDLRTDTLILRQPAAAVQVRMTLHPAPTVTPARLKFLGLCLADSTSSSAIPLPDRIARNHSLAVPTRSQLDYDGGSGWCSPTSLSMLLAFWARRLGQADLEWSVPETAARVHDPNWPGTGNWAFNVAFAGSLAGLRGCVSRFATVEELEAWVAADMPVAASVGYSLLKGGPQKPDDGHLVVCAGFTETGDVVVNDPGTRWEMRRIVRRSDFAAAWAVSRNTVYLVYPEGVAPPLNRWGHW